MLCKRCNTLMKETYRFEKGKSYRLFKCPVCHKEMKTKTAFRSEYGDTYGDGDRR